MTRVTILIVKQITHSHTSLNMFTLRSKQLRCQVCTWPSKTRQAPWKKIDIDDLFDGCSHGPLGTNHRKRGNPVDKRREKGKCIFPTDCPILLAPRAIFPVEPFVELWFDWNGLCPDINTILRRLTFQLLCFPVNLFDGDRSMSPDKTKPTAYVSGMKFDLILFSLVSEELRFMTNFIKLYAGYKIKKRTFNRLHVEQKYKDLALNMYI